MIVRFVPRVYGFDGFHCLRTATPTSPKKTVSAMGDLRILTRFRLRLLSRKWTALTYRQDSSIFLAYERGRLCFTDGEKGWPLLLSKPQVPPECAKMKELTDETVAVIERYSLLDHVTSLDVRMENRDWWNEPVSAVLSKLTGSVVTQPCELDLTLEISKHMEALHSFVHNFDTPFQQQFPNIALRELTFNMDEISAKHFRPKPEYYQAACRCLKHFLAPAGCSSLVQLDVNFFVLKAAFEAQQPGYAGSDPLPENWACESLRVLLLEFLPFEAAYDYASSAKRAELFAFQARLPKLFPNVESLTICHGRPQFDFAVLVRLPALSDLCVFAERLQQDCNVQPLPNVRSLQMQCDMPFALSAFVPHADSLAFWARSANDFACLTAEVYRALSSPLFQNLSELTIDASGRDRPPYADLIGLLRALASLPKLERLKINACRYLDAWSRDGDLSLLSVLPAGLKSLSVRYALVPSECVKVLPTPGRSWQMNVVNPDDPCLLENIYKGWLRNLLYQISTIPALEKVHCLCVAPSFTSIVRLAEKWNRGSEYALADLGLNCISHVQATENFQRIRVADAFQHEDAVRFRLSVTPQAHFERHSLKKSKSDPLAMKKIVSVTFEN